MGKFIVHWDTGYGASYAVLEADTKEDAEGLAYQSWREEAESNANYGVLEYTEDNCRDYDLEWEE